MPNDKLVFDVRTMKIEDLLRRIGSQYYHSHDAIDLDPYGFISDALDFMCLECHAIALDTVAFCKKYYELEGLSFNNIKENEKLDVQLDKMIDDLEEVVDKYISIISDEE